MSVDPDRLNQLIGRAFGDLAAGASGVMVSLGRRLGLYKVLAGAGRLNSTEVARRAECAERYVREWLHSQVAAEYLVYHAEDQTFEMTPEQAMVLADENSPCYFPAAWEVAASMWMDRVPPTVRSIGPAWTTTLATDRSTDSGTATGSVDASTSSSARQSSMSGPGRPDVDEVPDEVAR